MLILWVSGCRNFLLLLLTCDRLVANENLKRDKCIFNGVIKYKHLDCMYYNETFIPR